jgi:excisionase family DNA binding protein
MFYEKPPLAVSVSEALDLSGLGKTTIYGLLKQNLIESIRVGRRRLIIYASLKAFLEKGA